jgi:hypothetical protein
MPKVHTQMIPVGKLNASDISNSAKYLFGMLLEADFGHPELSSR